MQLEPAGPGAQLLPHPLLGDGVPLAQEQEVERHGVDGLQHRARCQAPGVTVGLRPVRRTRPAADDRRDAAGQRLVDQLRADQVDVRVDRAGRQDLPVAGDDLRRRADDEIGVDAVHGVGVAGLCPTP